MNIYSERWMGVCDGISDLHAMALALDRLVNCGCYSEGTIADAIQDVSKQVNKVQASFWMAQKGEDDDSDANFR